MSPLLALLLSTKRERWRATGREERLRERNASCIMHPAFFLTSWPVWLKAKSTFELQLSFSLYPYSILQPEARISKKYWTTKSGSPEVELRSCPWLILFIHWTGALLSVLIMCKQRGARSKVNLRWQNLRLSTPIPRMTKKFRFCVHKEATRSHPRKGKYNWDRKLEGWKRVARRGRRHLYFAFF